MDNVILEYILFIFHDNETNVTWVDAEIFSFFTDNILRIRSTLIEKLHPVDVIGLTEIYLIKEVIN